MAELQKQTLHSHNSFQSTADTGLAPLGLWHRSGVVCLQSAVL